MVATVSCYSASQALLGAVEVAAEVLYTGAAPSWSLSSGSPLGGTDAQTANFALASDGGRRVLRIVPEGGWQEGKAISVAYVVGTRDSAGIRAIFVQSSMADQGFLAYQSCDSLSLGGVAALGTAPAQSSSPNPAL